MKARVLITGGAGFIGSRTANALVREGHFVRVLDNLDPQVHGNAPDPASRLAPGVEFRRGDIRDLETIASALEDIDVVYHFAAATGVTQSMFQVERYIDINVRGTATLWDAIINRGTKLRRFILASSRAVYGEGSYWCATCHSHVFPTMRSPAQLSAGKWDVNCTSCGGSVEAVATAEDKIIDPQSIYAQSKMSQEQLCVTIARSRMIPLVVLRYFNVYGPDQALSNPYTGIAPAFCTRLLAKEKIPLYEDGLGIRDFVHIKDVVRANELALSWSGQESITVNIGSGEKCTILDLARLMCEVMGIPEAWHYTGQYRAGDIRSCFAETRSAARELGFASAVGLREGMMDLVAWVANSGFHADHYDESVQILEGKGLLIRSHFRKPNGNQ